QLPLSSYGLITAVQECRKRVVAVPARLPIHQRVRLQRRFEPGHDVAGLIAYLEEVCEIAGDLPLVPGGQDRIYIREVLVHSRAPDASPLRDLRHRHGSKSVLGHEGSRAVEDRVAPLTTVRLDRLVPGGEQLAELGSGGTWVGDCVDPPPRRQGHER